MEKNYKITSIFEDIQDIMGTKVQNQLAVQIGEEFY